MAKIQWRLCWSFKFLINYKIINRYYSYISTAIRVLQTARAGEPFTSQLKKFFAANKKYGSTDRKIIAGICYTFFRVAHLFWKEINETNIYKAIFLCETSSSKILAFLAPELNDKIELSIEEKFKMLNLQPEDIFPFTDLLSDEIDLDQFSISFLKQPLVFLRTRKGFQEKVKETLQQNDVLFQLPETGCISVENGKKISDLPGLNEQFVIQDLSSQHVLDHLNPAKLSSPLTAWDCCAASGGKSILLNDVLGFAPKLTVSDIRENILQNCRQRLQEANVRVQKYLKVDLVNGEDKQIKEKFDLIICDVPCTGSGTWSRTPEQLFFFEAKMVEEYATKQKLIFVNAIKHLKEKGLFFYITCSVFTKENEEMIHHIKTETGAQLLNSTYYKGMAQNADSLFVAVFTK